MQFEKLWHVYCERRKLCSLFSLDLVVLDQGLAFKGSEVPWVGKDLQSCVQDLLNSCSLYKGTGVRDRY